MPFHLAGEHMYTCGRFILIYGKPIQYCKVKKFKKKKKKSECQGGAGVRGLKQGEKSACFPEEHEFAWTRGS